MAKKRLCGYCGNKMRFVQVKRMTGYPLSGETETAKAWACDYVKWYHFYHNKFVINNRPQDDWKEDLLLLIISPVFWALYWGVYSSIREILKYNP